VFIGLGSGSTPDGSAGIMSVDEWNSNITCGFGVYLIPYEFLENHDDA